MAAIGSDLAAVRGMDIGHQLVTARERRGLTLKDISRTTKIPVSLLEAIERDDLARLPQGFFTRAFVRAYAHEVGLNADDLLNSARLGEVEEFADAPDVPLPIDEPSSSRSLCVGIALGMACTIVYFSYVSPTPAPVAVSASATRVTEHVEPAAFAPPPCAPAVPAGTDNQTVRRATPAPEKTRLHTQPIPVTHVVPGTPIEPSVGVIDSPPIVSDAILPTPDSGQAAPVEQF